MTPTHRQEQLGPLLEQFAPGLMTRPTLATCRKASDSHCARDCVDCPTPALLLDEPTRGLDYPGKENFTKVLRQLAAEGHAIMLATHDVELVASTATRVVMIADGEIVADGPTAEVVTSSPMFAPQISKVMRPYPFLTVDQAIDAMAAITP